MIVVLIILLIVLYYVYISTNNTTVEHLNTFNGRMAVDTQYYYDKLLDNVTYFPNQYNQAYDTAEEIGELVETGLAKCRSTCTGNCVEFGVTSAAYCFPY